MCSASMGRTDPSRQYFAYCTMEASFPNQCECPVTDGVCEHTIAIAMTHLVRLLLEGRSARSMFVVRDISTLPGEYVNAIFSVNAESSFITVACCTQEQLRVKQPQQPQLTMLQFRPALLPGSAHLTWWQLLDRWLQMQRPQSRQHISNCSRLSGQMANLSQASRSWNKPLTRCWLLRKQCHSSNGDLNRSLACACAGQCLKLICMQRHTGVWLHAGHATTFWHEGLSRTSTTMLRTKHVPHRWAFRWSRATSNCRMHNGSFVPKRKRMRSQR